MQTNAGETIDQRMFTSDGNKFYPYWNSKTNPWYSSSVAMHTNRNDNDYDVRWLVKEDLRIAPAGYSCHIEPETKELEPDEGSALRCVESYEVDGTDYGLYQGVFGMPNFTSSTDDIEVEFLYSDGYFMENPKQYNEHMATMSFALALAAGYSNKGNEGSADDLYHTAGNGSTYYPIKSTNITTLLGDLGVKPEDIYLNYYDRVKPETDSMGVAIGSKRIGDKTLVIIGTRGAGYEAEWASNVTLGGEGEAAGFSRAATIAFSSLQDYLIQHGIDGSSEDTLFWISGFSRGGATANLTAKRIVDKYDNAGERTFAYPMEPPKGGLDSEERAGCDYSCIHNVINNEDIVPYVAPAEMGFKRYGVDHYMPGTAANSDEIQVETNLVDIKDESGNVVRSIVVTTKRDNEPLTGKSYEGLRSEMIKQLYAVNDDVIYDDYFYQATFSFVGNYVEGDNISSMIQEVDNGDETYWTAASFIPAFFQHIQNVGFNYAVSGTSKTDDYRSMYAVENLFGDVSFQNAAREICGIAFSLDAKEMTGLMDVLGSVMDRVSAKDLYLDIFYNGV